MITIRKTITILMSVLIAATVCSGCSVITSVSPKKTKTKIAERPKTSVDSFTSIQLDVDVAGVEIIPEADGFAIEYHVVDQDVEYSIKGGVLTLKAKGGESVTIHSDEKSDIKIYVPAGSEFTSIDSKVDVGNVRADKIKVDDMTVNIGVGNAILSDVTVNQTLSAESGVGNIEASLASGDCSYDLTAGVGEVQINGTKYSGIDVKQKYTSAVGPQVTITTGTGNIDLVMDEEECI